MKQCAHEWREVSQEPALEWCEMCGTLRYVFEEGAPVYARPTHRGMEHDYTKAGRTPDSQG